MEAAKWKGCLSSDHRLLSSAVGYGLMSAKLAI